MLTTAPTSVFSIQSAYAGLAQYWTATTTALQDDQRDKAIEKYVARYNERQRGVAYSQSIQARISRIKRDVTYLKTLRRHLGELSAIYEHLEETTLAFAETAPLIHDASIRHEVCLLKEARLTILSPIETLLHDKKRREVESQTIDIALQHLQYAYEENCKALIKLRKIAKEDLICMYRVYRVMRLWAMEMREQYRVERHFSCGFEQALCVFVMRHGGKYTEQLICGDAFDVGDALRIIFENYASLIFAAIVLVDQRTLREAFDAIDTLVGLELKV